jgi:hypothetical protein
MEVRFLIDRDTGLPHIDRHGVSERQARDVLRNGEADVSAEDGARMAEGQSADGRYLRVVYRLNESDDSILVVTAYDLSPKALKALRKRRRRRSRR